MLFFIEEDNNEIDHINRINVEDYLDAITVKAVLIGSSNQSYNTFYAKTYDKGECDLLMYISDDDPDPQMWNRASVISRALTNTYAADHPEILLKDMLREVFNHYLADLP